MPYHMNCLHGKCFEVDNDFLGADVDHSVDASNIGNNLTYGDQPPQSTMQVSVSKKMTRFRYDTELNNRNIGKEELLSIKVMYEIVKTPHPPV